MSVQLYQVDDFMTYVLEPDSKFSKNRFSNNASRKRQLGNTNTRKKSVGRASILNSASATRIYMPTASLAHHRSSSIASTSAPTLLENQKFRSHDSMCSSPTPLASPSNRPATPNFVSNTTVTTASRSSSVASQGGFRGSRGLSVFAPLPPEDLEAALSVKRDASHQPTALPLSRKGRRVRPPRLLTGSLSSKVTGYCRVGGVLLNVLGWELCREIIHYWEVERSAKRWMVLVVTTDEIRLVNLLASDINKRVESSKKTLAKLHQKIMSTKTGRELAKPLSIIYSQLATAFSLLSNKCCCSRRQPDASEKICNRYVRWRLAIDQVESAEIRYSRPEEEMDLQADGKKRSSIFQNSLRNSVFQNFHFGGKTDSSSNSNPFKPSREGSGKGELRLVFNTEHGEKEAWLHEVSDIGMPSFSISNKCFQFSTKFVNFMNQNNELKIY